MKYEKRLASYVGSDAYRLGFYRLGSAVFESCIGIERSRCGDVSSVRLTGGRSPYALSFLLRGETKDVPIAEANAFLIGQVNTIRSSADEVLIEFKAMKPFKGALIVRDAAGREAKFDLYSGDERLLREFGKNPR